MQINNNYLENKFIGELKNIVSPIKKFIQDNVNLIALAVFSAIGLLAFVSYRIYVKKKKAQKLNKQNFKFDGPPPQNNQQPVGKLKAYKADPDRLQPDPKPAQPPLPVNNNHLWSQLGKPQPQPQTKTQIQAQDHHTDAKEKEVAVNPYGAVNFFNDPKPAPLFGNNDHLRAPLMPQFENFQPQPQTQDQAQDHHTDAKEVVVNPPAVLNLVNDPKPAPQQPVPQQPAPPPVIKNASWLELAGPRVQDDYETVKMAIENDPEAFKFASDGLKNNRFLVQLAVSKKGSLLELAGPKPQDDYDTVKVAIENNPEAFKFASDRLKNYPALVQLAISKK